MKVSKPYLAVLAAILALAGCATDPGPNSVGNGRYLQIYSGTVVAYEMDVVAAGHLNCPNQAAMIVQQNPSLTAKCSHEATTQPLPFSYKAHFQTNTGDELKPSSPFVVRLVTSEVCAASMKSTLAQPKSVILEDHCGVASSESASSAPLKAAASTPAAAPTTRAPAQSVTGKRDEATQLQKLKELFDKRLITEDEYKAKRREILDNM